MHAYARRRISPPRPPGLPRPAFALAVALGLATLMPAPAASGAKDAWDALDKNLAALDLRAFRPAETGWYPGGVVGKRPFPFGKVVELVTPTDRFWVDGFDYLQIYKKSRAELANASVFRGLELGGKLGVSLNQLPIDASLVTKLTESYSVQYRGETIWRLPEQSLIEYRSKIRRSALGPFLSPGPKYIPLKILMVTGVDVSFHGRKGFEAELSSPNILQALGVKDAEAGGSAQLKYSGKSGSTLSFDVADPKDALAIAYGMFLPLTEDNRQLLLQGSRPSDEGVVAFESVRGLPAGKDSRTPQAFPDPVVKSMDTAPGATTRVSRSLR